MKRTLSPWFTAGLLLVGVAAGVSFGFGGLRRQARVAQVSGQQVLLRVSPDTPANKELLKAAQGGDAKAIRAALEAGGDPDAVVTDSTPESAKTPIAMMATYSEPGEESTRIPGFREIVIRAKDVNAAESRFGRTLLMAAVDLNDLDSVKSLVERGANVNAATKGNATMAGLTALHQAILIGGGRSKDLPPVLTYLLEHGANPNVADGRSTTPLMQAALYGKADDVRELLKHGADPKMRAGDGRTALDFAVQRNEQEVAALLDANSPMDLGQAASMGNVRRLKEALAAGGDPNQTTAQGLPLTAASRSGNADAVRLLLDHGAKINVPDNQGQTALHHAALLGNDKVVQVLLQRGADPNALAKRMDVRGEPPTPLMAAVSQARADIVQVLLRKADLKRYGQLDAALRLAVQLAGQGPSYPVGVPRKRRAEGEVLNSQSRILDLLLKAGADVKADHSRCVAMAAENSQTELVRLLLDRGADVNGRERVSDQVFYGATALIAAIDATAMSQGLRDEMEAGRASGSMSQADVTEEGKRGRATVELLLKRGANVNLGDAFGKTALMHCVEMETPELIPTLLAHKANVEVVDAEGQTVLMHACAEGQLPVVQTLLKAGAKINAVDKAGRSALMLAIDAGDNARVRKAQAEMDDHMAHHGQSPRTITREELPNPYGHPDIVRLLVQKGARVDVRAKDGSTPLSLARKEGFNDVVAVLRKAGARN